MQNGSLSPDLAKYYPDPKVMLAGLLVACPYQANQDICPLHAIRQKTLPQRVKWLGELTHDQVVDLLNRHEQCLVKAHWEKTLTA